MSDFEAICTNCDGAGKLTHRVPSFAEVAAMSPQRYHLYAMQNASGWYRSEDGRFEHKHCDRCNGEGFRPQGTSVPLIMRAAAGAGEASDAASRQ